MGQHDKGDLMGRIQEFKNSRIQGVAGRKQRLQPLPLHFASSSRQTAKAGAFAYVALPSGFLRLLNS
jgi:hypothetical protein